MLGSLDPQATAMLASVAALGLLHLIMFVGLYATRIPAMIKAKIPAHKATKTSMDSLPKWAVNVADNYNHLFEAPTVFYAMVFAIILSGLADQTSVWASWSYVGLRYVHSAVQATINIIMVRFLVFSLSWIVLGFLIVRFVLQLAHLI